jgi:HSP20 family protein
MPTNNALARETRCFGFLKRTFNQSRRRVMAKRNGEKESKSLAPWRSFSDISRWERDMERTFDELFERRLSPFRGSRWWPMSTKGGFSVPAVDLYEDKNELVAKVDLPGLEKDDIEVNITDQALTVKGERKKEEEIKEDDYYRSERSYGSFSRTVDLPKDLAVDKARASFKNGLLEVRIPRTEDAKKKETKISID